MATSGNGGQGGFYRVSPTKDFAGMVHLMKIYVRKRSTWIDTILLKDSQIPATPKLAYSGPPDFSHLTFDISEYNGSNPFAALQWRIAEVTPAGARVPGARPEGPVASQVVPNHYEIAPLWQSAELPEFNSHFVLPSLPLHSSTAYRIRARVKDQTGRWSHWSPPFEFAVP